MIWLQSAIDGDFSSAAGDQQGGVQIDEKIALPERLMIRQLAGSMRQFDGLRPNESDAMRHHESGMEIALLLDLTYLVGLRLLVCGIRLISWLVFKESTPINDVRVSERFAWGCL
jgi:hypothetical protein